MNESVQWLNLNKFLLAIQNRMVDQEVINHLLKEGIISLDFELRYLLGSAFRSFSKISMETNLSFIVIEEGGLPYQAEFGSKPEGALDSFKFSCQGCFGEDSSCGVCGGSGWGVL